MPVSHGRVVEIDLGGLATALTKSVRWEGQHGTSEAGESMAMELLLFLLGRLSSEP